MSSTTSTLAEQDESTNSQKHANQTTPRAGLSSYRVLYRGSLALPDSEMLLDGIIFVMQIARNSPMSLINSPIPLGLESMRGRSLRLISTVSIEDMRVECFGDVSMYIHPDAFLTRSFFERTLCTDDPNGPLLPDGTFTHLRTSLAVRIGLGDGTGPDETDILVFGQLSTPAPGISFPNSSSATSTQKAPQTLQLLAGRIAPPTPAPDTPQQRKIARPDDPLPRPHPLANLHLSPGRRGIKRKRSGNNPFGPFHLNASGANGDTGSALVAAIAQGERLKKQGKVVVDAPSAKGLSKRPALFQHHQGLSGPSTPNSTSTATPVSRGQSVDRDGFLVPDVPVRALAAKKDKDKGRSPLKAAGEGLNGVGEEARRREGEGDTAAMGEVESEMEGKNKTAIKKRTLAALEACGISKQHAQFRDMYGWIHRGVAFAVVRALAQLGLRRLTQMYVPSTGDFSHQRGVVQDTKVDRELLTKLIEVHLEMYMGGRGGRYQAPAQSHSISQSQSQGDSHTPARSTPTVQAGYAPTIPSSANELSAEPKQDALHAAEDDNQDLEMDLTLGKLTLDSTHLDVQISEVLFDSSSSPGTNTE